MKGKLIVVLLNVVFLNVVVFLFAYIFSLIPEQHKSTIVTIIVGLGILVFLAWSFGHGNLKLFRLAKLPNEKISTPEAIWNFAKILVGGMILWNLIFELL